MCTTLVTGQTPVTNVDHTITLLFVPNVLLFLLFKFSTFHVIESAPPN